LPHDLGVERGKKVRRRALGSSLLLLGAVAALAACSGSPVPAHSSNATRSKASPVTAAPTAPKHGGSRAFVAAESIVAFAAVNPGFTLADIASTLPPGFHVTLYALASNRLPPNDVIPSTFVINYNVSGPRPSDGHACIGSLRDPSWTIVVDAECAKTRALHRTATQWVDAFSAQTVLQNVLAARDAQAGPVTPADLSVAASQMPPGIGIDPARSNANQVTVTSSSGLSCVTVPGTVEPRLGPCF
jgi:hypothetical protein